MAVQVIVDLVTRRLPLQISLSTACLMLLVGGVLARSGSQFLAMACGGLVMGITAQILVTISRGSLGRGDVFFCLPLGMVLGVGSTPSTTVAITLYAWAIAALVGGVTACIGLLFRRYSKQSTIPYGPFLVIGTIAMLAVRGTP